MQDWKPKLARHGAVAVVAGRERRKPTCPFLLPSQPIPFCLVGSIGTHHLEQPLPEPPEHDRVELTGQVQEMPLSDRSRREIVILLAQQVDCLDDHPGLVDIDLPIAQRLPGRHERLVELLGQPQARRTGHSRLVRRSREPGRGRGGAAVGTDLIAVSADQHPHL